MRTHKWLKKMKMEKGVSPVIAVVLMIAVAVAISITVYAWATGFTSEKTGTESLQYEQLILESQSISGGFLIIAVRNISDIDVVIDTLYVDGQLRHSGIDIYISKGMVSSIAIPMPCHSISVGDNVMLVTKRGTQIKFKARG